MANVWGKGKRKADIVRTGTPWANAKHDAVATYLRGYAIQGLAFPGSRTFIEAVAGAAYGQRVDDDADPTMPDLSTPDAQALVEGLRVVGLETQPGFHAYRFFERRKPRVGITEERYQAHGWLEPGRSIRCGPEPFAAMVGAGWTGHRAVMVLDPYGLEVDREVITAIAHTRAIDLWLWYPVAIGAARLAGHPDGWPSLWRAHLDRLLGGSSWAADVAAAPGPAMLIPDDAQVAVARASVLGQHLVRALRPVFAHLPAPPAVLRDAAGRPLYVCCFAAADQPDVADALRYAGALLKRLAA